MLTEYAKRKENVAREIGEKHFCLQIEHTAIRKVTQPRGYVRNKTGLPDFICGNEADTSVGKIIKTQKIVF